MSEPRNRPPHPWRGKPMNDRKVAERRAKDKLSDYRPRVDGVCGVGSDDGRYLYRAARFDARRALVKKL